MNEQRKWYNLRIFDEAHKDDWKFFIICGIICNVIYLSIFRATEIEYSIFPFVLLGFNLITPATMLICEFGERKIYG